MARLSQARFARGNGLRLCAREYVVAAGRLLTDGHLGQKGVWSGEAVDAADAARGSGDSHVCAGRPLAVVVPVPQALLGAHVHEVLGGTARLLSPRVVRAAVPELGCGSGASFDGEVAYAASIVVYGARGGRAGGVCASVQGPGGTTALAAGTAMLARARGMCGGARGVARRWLRSSDDGRCGGNLVEGRRVVRSVVCKVLSVGVVVDAKAGLCVIDGRASRTAIRAHGRRGGERLEVALCGLGDDAEARDEVGDDFGVGGGDGSRGGGGSGGGRGRSVSADAAVDGASLGVAMGSRRDRRFHVHGRRSAVAAAQLQVQLHDKETDRLDGRADQTWDGDGTGGRLACYRACQGATGSTWRWENGRSVQ